MGIVDTKWHDQIIYNLDHLPLLDAFPESLKASIGDIPEARGMEIYGLPLYGMNGGNGKSLPVFQLLESAQEAGRVFPGCTLIFPSSGSAAQMAAYYKDAFGIEEVVVVLDRATPLGKKAQVILPGSRIEYPQEGQTTLERAAELEKEIPNSVFINQYSEYGSVLGHKRTMNHIAREMKRLGKNLNFLGAATGTCSTYRAGYEFLKPEFPNLHIVGVGCEGEQTPGARTLAAIKRDVKFDWEEVAKPYGLVFCDKHSAFAMSRNIIEKTRKPAGPTSGLVLEGFLRRVRYLAERKELGQFLNPDGTSVAVLILMDAFPAYGADYLNILGIEV